MLSTLPTSIAQGTGFLRDRYLAARPFPHVVVDNFLPPELVRDLMAEFPAFDESLAISENGVAEGKMVRSDLPSLGPGFLTLHALLRGEDFRRFLSSVTGIEGLLFDPSYFGGGVHLSLPGQELDPHLDFNLHPQRNWRRRVNVLLYLNPGWAESHGGGLELHRDPRNPADDETAAIPPLANRLVIFETNDSSWHGHGPIAAAPRRSVAVYFYTDASHEVNPPLPHYTVYADRPLHGHETASQLALAFSKRRSHLRRQLQAERGSLETLAKMADKSLAALSSLENGQGEAADKISTLDTQIAASYEREKLLQRMLDELSLHIETLRFLSDEPPSGDGHA